MMNEPSEFSIRLESENTELYGSTTVSDADADGATEKVLKMRSGYSSFSLARSRVPSPDPVPPPREWTN